MGIENEKEISGILLSVNYSSYTINLMFISIHASLSNQGCYTQEANDKTHDSKPSSIHLLTVETRTSYFWSTVDDESFLKVSDESKTWKLTAWQSSWHNIES